MVMKEKADGQSGPMILTDIDDVDETDKSKINDEVIDDVACSRMIINSDIKVLIGQRKLLMPSLSTHEGRRANTAD